MNINPAEKEYIFSIIKEKFNFPFKRESDVYSWFEQHCLFEQGFDYRNGTSKICLFHDSFNNFVVKFGIDSDFDYCEREYLNYCAAVERGLEIYFPYTDCLGYINGINFFIQERAECDENEMTSIWYNSIKEGWAEEEDEGYIWDMVYDLEDEQKVMYIYGDKEKLFDFLDDYCINDLHEGNFGMINERIVIIDFSGYGSKVERMGINV